MYMQIVDYHAIIMTTSEGGFLLKNKITDRLSRLFLILFLFVTGYITWFTFTGMQQTSFLSQMLSVPGENCPQGRNACFFLAFWRSFFWGSWC